MNRLHSWYAIGHWRRDELPIAWTLLTTTLADGTLCLFDRAGARHLDDRAYDR